ncbi:MAG: zinc ribbon domain-containing protein, partial [Planctomycetota bacterium]|nr:zinc ribbon domain-containing protein [Planctomycetota bacterium]
MDDPRRGFLDTIVEAFCALAQRVGLPGSRWSWRWQNLRRRWAEQGEQTANKLRSVRGEHKMCPQCRALVPKNATQCPECGEPLTGVATPGVGRLISNLVPGGASVVSLLTLLIGGLFLLTL